MLYDVTITRSTYSEHTFRVDANDEAEARMRAEMEADSHDFDADGVSEAEDTVSSVVEVK